MARAACDVLVIGAGVAGLAAAGAVAARGLKTTLLEARPRLGGRVLTVREPLHGEPIELGAEFVHGAPPRVLAIARAAGLAIDEIDGEHWRSRGGRLSKMTGFEEELERAMKPVLGARGADRSLRDVLDASRTSRASKALARSYVEGFHAARADRVSARALARMQREESDEATRIARFERGWGAIAAWLRDRLDPDVCRIHASCVVTEIAWRARRVTVRARSATGFALEPFEARAAIVALPLGVLQAAADAEGAVRFDPPLADRARPLARLAMGDVARTVLRFREPIAEWFGGARGEALRRMAFLHAPGADVEVWWTALPRRSPLVTAWCGGPRAEAMLALTETARLERLVVSLASSLGLPRRAVEERLEAWHAHDWSRDPFSRGAYSYALVGGADAGEALAKPIARTLFFAGEHTAPGSESGTVHGAIASGERAARELLASC